MAMAWTEAAAALVFAATFLALALGRVGRRPVPRGLGAAAGGAATWILLAPGGRMTWEAWRLVDWQVMALLAGLMVLAGLAQEAGLLAGLRRSLAPMRPAWALWTALVVVAATSALLLNDAAVVVLVPFLLPTLMAQGLPAVPTVVLMAVAANAGSLLTPFGNPQNAALASHAGLGVGDFLAQQGPLVLAALALLGLAAWRVARHTGPAAPGLMPPPASPRGRPWLLACIALFLAGAAVPSRSGLGLGVAALAAAGLAWLGLRLWSLRWRHDVDAVDAAAWRSLDWNVLLLFLGLYLLTAGLRAWFPLDLVPLALLDEPVRAALATTAIANVVGNVPAILAFIALDPDWTRAHAPFLVSVSTLGGALLLTGSAASLLAAEQARRMGVEVRFWPFLVHAAPWVLPVLALGAWTNWGL